MIPRQLLETELARLHDAVLLTVEVNWADGTIILQTSAAHGSWIIVISGATYVQIPRNQPWGPSVCINAIRLQLPKQTLQRIELEMQSGDVISIEGETLSVEQRVP